MFPSVAKVALLAGILELGCGLSQDGRTDENRPYEFGFSIEGEQHRYEKKDENGIIMGEYGFITADGVYHVTVYATDENGNFRILKTRNIRIGLKMVQPTTTTTTKPTVRKPIGLNGCSGCLIPTTTGSPPTPKQPQIGVQQIPHDNSDLEENPPIDVRFQTPQINSNTYPERTQSSIYNKQQPIGTFKNPSDNQKTLESSVGNNNQMNKQPAVYPENINVIQLGHKPINDSPTYTSHGETDTPTLLSNKVNLQNRLNNNNIHSSPGSDKIGVQPKSEVQLSEAEKNIMDFMANLYKFNYTLTFHGHEEEGDIAGKKRGSYFNNGRDGYQRKVVYLANEFGYQPTVTLVKLDEASTPNELTEKDLTQLKGNEFIWFYHKTNSS